MSIKSHFTNKQNVLLGFVLIAVIAGIFVVQAVIARAKSGYTDLTKQYPHLSKRIFTENENDLLLHFVPLRTALRQRVEEYGDGFAFYFEYLPTGISIGMNEKMLYPVHSLLKVPLVMAYYDGVERQGVEREQPATIEEEDINKLFGSLWQKGVGSQITLPEAARLTLVESDNTAARVLARHIEYEDYADVYNGLDIDLPPDVATPIPFSAKGYASIFKALYFSSILERKDSERILDWLSKTPFSDKLAAGVPPGIPVAHKIGVLDGQVYQDCGIVYEPYRPYVLCLFSTSSEDVARERMRTISGMIYSFIHATK